MSRLTLVLAAVFAVVFCSLATAEPPKKQDADEAAIRRAVQSYIAAFNRGDARAVANHWSEDGVYVTPSGERLQGRKAITDFFADYFAETTGQNIELGTPAIRFLTPSVAVEEGAAEVSRRGEPPSTAAYIAIHVKNNGQWKIDSVRETIVSTTPSHYEQLKELEWLVGRWVDKAGDSSIETDCQWTKNKNFMTRSFKVAIEDCIELEGTQVIGWDPDSQAIRSWVFDSDGGFGEATWTRRGDRWIIKAKHTLNGGEKASSVNILTKVDDNSFKWQSIGREVDGELLPNIDEVTVVRDTSN